MGGEEVGGWERRLVGGRGGWWVVEEVGEWWRRLVSGGGGW